MTKRGLLCALAAAAVASVAASAPASAQAADPSLAPAQREGEWEVREDKEGCTAAARFSDGTSFVLSYDSYEAEGFIFLGNARWRSVEPGRQYSFEVEMSPLGVHSLSGTGTPVEGLGGFSIPFRGDALIGEFMEAETMAIQIGRNVVGRYSLTGSYAAALELARCNRRALDRVREDPFAQ